MKPTKSLFKLFSLTGILATVSVSQRVPFESVSHEPLSNYDNNEQNPIGTTNLAQRLIRRGLRSIDHVRAMEIDVSSGFDPSYAMLHALMDKYKRKHGQSQLMRELQICKERNRNMNLAIQPGIGCPELEKRKFLVSYYSCPESAGNRLHHFMNGMIWALVTGRTLLYDIFDNETCHKLCKASDRPKTFWCEQHGTAQETMKECNQAMQLTEWIPSFREWKEELGLEEPTHAYCGSGGGRAEFQDGITVDVLPDRVISACLGVMQNAGRVLLEQLKSPSGVSTNGPLSRDSAIKAARILMRVDSINLTADDGLHQFWYLYGVLFNEAFTIRSHLLPESAEIVSGPDVASIAIHSRHIYTSNDGSDIEEERACLRYVLKRIKDEKGVDRCAVYIMSDRSTTVRGLAKESELLGCEAIMLHKHKHGHQGVLLEHGSFDKFDFISDLALVSNAEDGLIGPGRPSTSTFLLREMMEYNRKKRGINEKIVTCHLSRQNK